MSRTHRTARPPRSWAPVVAVAAGALLLAGCTTDGGQPAPETTPPAASAPADAGAEAGSGGSASPEPSVTRAPGPPTEDELATCSTLAQVLPDSTKLVQALGDGKAVDPTLLDRVKQGDAALAGMAPENMQPLVTSFSTIVDELDALRSGADTDGASLDTGQYLRATSAFLDYCLDDVGYVPPSATPAPAP
ncbi:hypothetical protein [Clavibacter michiganensis]|uniref:Lipoprotein n=1 Tax=Clavibacter michiganensis TaxID=28447 RepID=A0A251YSE3_9MICO|nr:hypothetical protein [Clavibacter michiganensis]OUE27156.1 hypothetical protein BFL37_03485 [Clavibacter michiganensis]